MGKEYPIITSNMGGIPELILNRKTGLLIESASAERLATARSKLLKAPDLGTALCSYGRARAIKYFSIDSIMDQWMKADHDMVYSSW